MMKLPLKAPRLKNLIDPKTSAYAPLIGENVKSIKLFHPSETPNDDTDHSIYGCVCVQGDCDGEWPIALADVQPEGDPPYRCARYDGKSVVEPWR